MEFLGRGKSGRTFLRKKGIENEGMDVKIGEEK